MPDNEAADSSSGSFPGSAGEQPRRKTTDEKPPGDVPAVAEAGRQKHERPVAPSGLIAADPYQFQRASASSTPKTLCGQAWSNGRTELPNIASKMQDAPSMTRLPPLRAPKRY